MELGTADFYPREVSHDRASAEGKSQSGYTKAVDLWSLGCVTVVLLTGGGAFLDPRTGTYSERSAQACDMSLLRDSTDWQRVRSRPRSFVEQLLVLKEDERLTAPEALHHEWFSNEAHKTNFEDLYQRAIRHWRPSPPRRDIVEFHDASLVRSFMYPRRVGFEYVRGGSSDVPVDAHYQPAPKNLWSTFWPKRNKSRLLPEKLRGATGRWPSQTRDKDTLEGDEDDGREDEDQATLHKARRRDSLRLNQTGSRSPAGRHQRSSSEPPRLTSLLRVSKLGSNIGKTRASPGEPLPAMMPLQGASSKASRRSPVFIRKSSPLREPNFFKESNTTTDRSRPLSKKSDPLSASIQHTEMAKTSPDTTSEAETPVQTDRLRRWLSSPVQYPDTLKLPTKRRRGSVFDIEEDGEDDAETSPCQREAKKPVKKAKFVHEGDEVHEDSEKDGADEVTFPHRPAGLSVSEDLSAARGLYLPR